MSRLRVGLILPGDGLRAWQARSLAELAEVDGLEIAVLVSGPWPGAVPEEAGQEERGAWASFVRRRSGARPPLEAAELPEAVRGVPVLEAPGGLGSLMSHPDSPLLTELSKLDLDSLIALGPEPAPTLAAFAELGLWSFRHGDPERPLGAPPGFWELHEGEHTVHAVLQCRDHPGAPPRVLHRGAFKAVQDSWIETVDGVLDGWTGWPARACREVLATGLPRGEPLAGAPPPKLPSPLQVWLLRGRLGFARLHAVWEELFAHEQWTVGILDRPPQALLNGAGPEDIRWLRPLGRNRYVADPFGVMEGSRLRVMVEEYDYAAERGWITALDLPEPPEEALPPPTRRAMGRPEHMSYPYLFRWEGEIYCVPESHESGAVCLFRAVELPWEWEEVGTLVEDFPALDPTVFRHEDRWWLFATRFQPGTGSHLHAWWADELGGPWRPHALNPIKCDIRSARPGGTPFRRLGELYRPAQDCSRTYGGAVTLNRVVRLDPEAFREETAAVLRPEPGGPFPDGLHTVAAVGELTLLDGKRRRFAPAAFRNRILRRLGR